MKLKFWFITCIGVVVLTSGSCEAICGCESLPPLQKSVVGFVMHANNTPFVGVHIMALFAEAECGAPASNYTSQEDAADVEGRYDFAVSSFEPALCARLVAHAGADSIVHESIAIDMTRGAPDTIRVEFTFP